MGESEGGIVVFGDKLEYDQRVFDSFLQDVNIKKLLSTVDLNRYLGI